MKREGNDRKMKIHIVIDETVFFHPEFLLDLLERIKDECVGASIITAVGKKNNIERYMMSHFYYLRFSEMLRLGWRKAKLSMLDLVNKDSMHTVKSVLEKKNVPYEQVKYHINTPDHIGFIRNGNPDVVLSSQSLYFGKELLELPRICCINRHSGLLPRNGGLWPGFQVVRKGENETGVSIHVMESKIDAGMVLSQVKVPVKPGETIWEIYKECFEKSADAVLEALDKIRRNDFSEVKNEYEREYYSFPTKEHWKEFRERGGKYI